MDRNLLESADDWEQLQTRIISNNIIAKLNNNFQRTRLTNTIHLTLKTTSAQVVETPVRKTVLFRTTYPGRSMIIEYKLQNGLSFTYG